MQIRRAAAGDVPAIAACARRAYAQYVEAIGREPTPMVADFAAQVSEGKVSVVENPDGGIAGYIVCYPDGRDYHVENVAVEPAMAGQGLGRRLMAHVEDLARESGSRALALYTNVHMTGNLTLYPHLGYRETDRRTEDGFERVYFRKDLP